MIRWVTREGVPWLPRPSTTSCRGPHQRKAIAVACRSVGEPGRGCVRLPFCSTSPQPEPGASRASVRRALLPRRNHGPHREIAASRRARTRRESVELAGTRSGSRPRSSVGSHTCPSATAAGRAVGTADTTRGLLEMEPEPHLRGQCKRAQARFCDRRKPAASCGGTRSTGMPSAVPEVEPAISRSSEGAPGLRWRFVRGVVNGAGPACAVSW